MIKKPVFVLLMLFTVVSSIAQTQLYKGNNLLIPSNLMVNYAVILDTCFKMVDGRCVDPKSKAYLSNSIEKNLFEIIAENAFTREMKFYQTDSWVTYQLLENKKQISATKALEELGETIDFAFDRQELVGLNFIEEWKVVDKPFAFEKNVIGYSPIRRYFSENDRLHENPLFKFPFTVIDTLEKKSKIRKSNRRMQLTNQIASEYFFYLDYTPPFEIDQLMKIYDKSTQNLGDHILNKETSEYLSRNGVFNFLKTLLGKVLGGELKAYNYFDNQPLTIRDVEKEMGSYKVMVEDDSVIEPSLIEQTIPMDFSEIQSLIFIEKWYMDPVTLRMQKKVVGVAPVRFYYADNDEYKENLIRKVIFKVYFEKKDME